MGRYLVIRIVWLLAMCWFILTILFFSLNIGMWRFWFSAQPFTEVMTNTTRYYIVYLSRVMSQWDWGLTQAGDHAWDIMMEKAPISLRINLITLVVYVTFSIALGFIAARRENRLIDRVISVMTLIFSSVPNFIWVWFLIFFFGFRWEILPPQPHGVEGTLTGNILILIIPVVSLALYPLGKLTALFRGEFLHAQRAHYSTLLRVKGLTTTQMARRHWFKDALVPILGEIPNTFVFVLSSSFLIERFYSINGVTLLFFDALFAPMSDTYVLSVDLPLAMTTTAFFIFLILTLVLIVDLLNAWLDPRIRFNNKENIIT